MTKRSSRATTAVASSSRPEKETTLAVEVPQLAPERFYVLLVGFDAVPIGLQALERSGVVALVAGAHRFLFGERLLRLNQVGLLGRELLLEDVALPAFRAVALGGRFPGEARFAHRRTPRPRRLRRRCDIDLGGDQLALAPGSLAPVVGVARPARGVDAFVDLGA